MTNKTQEKTKKYVLDKVISAMEKAKEVEIMRESVVLEEIELLENDKMIIGFGIVEVHIPYEGVVVTLSKVIECMIGIPNKTNMDSHI
jgi:hypothetical protein